MFGAKQIAKLNDLEMLAFDYIVKHPDEAQQATIRDLAQNIHVSTSTIVRVSSKLGFDGFAEFKYYLKNEYQQKTPEEQHYDNMLDFNLFLKRLGTDDYQKLLERASQIIHNAEYTVFMGLGTSGSLASYASKYFVNMGLPAYVITDPFQAVQVSGNLVAVIISASGETEQVVNKELEFKDGGAQIISITNSPDCTVAKLADLRLSYNLVNEWSKRYPLGNVTTHLPVLALLEILAHKTVALMEQSDAD
jgi:DNA-binding MurR/RpiR family transcriptional regulator